MDINVLVYFPISMTKYFNKHNLMKRGLFWLSFKLQTDHHGREVTTARAGREIATLHAIKSRQQEITHMLSKFSFIQTRAQPAFSVGFPTQISSIKKILSRDAHRPT